MRKVPRHDDVKCPYFVRFSSGGIVCRGLRRGGVIEHRYAREAERTEHLLRFCSRVDGYTACPIARSHDAHEGNIIGAPDVRRICNDGIAAEISARKSLLYPFVYGAETRLILPTVKIYASLDNALIDATALPIGFIIPGDEKEEAVLLCLVRRGYVPDCDGIEGVEYWVIDKVDPELRWRGAECGINSEFGMRNAEFARCAFGTNLN